MIPFVVVGGMLVSLSVSMGAQTCRWNGCLYWFME